MLFSLKRIFHNIRRRLGVYLVFILEFAIGVAILSSTLNVVYSLQRDLKEAKAKMQDSIMEIQWHSTSWDKYAEMNEHWITPWEQEIAVSYDQYAKIKKLYGEDMDILYTLQTQSMRFRIKPANQEEDYPLTSNNYVGVYYITNPKFKEIFGVDMEPGKVYAGETALGKIDKYLGYLKNPEYVNFEGNYPMPLTEKDGKLAYFDGRDFELAANPTTNKKYFIDDREVDLKYEPITLSEIIFVPIDEFRAYRDFLRKNFNPYNNYYVSLDIHEDSDTTLYYTKTAHHAQPSFRSDLSVKLTNENADVNLIPSLLTLLNSSSKDKEFTLSQELLEIQHLADSIDQSITIQLIISASVMLIVVLGTTGLFLIYLYRRKKQMAVSIAYGSTKKRMFGEIFTEVMIITGLGTAAGLYALRFTMAYALKLYSSATMHLASIIIPIAAAVVCSLITALLAFSGVGEIAPAKILKEL